jgi:hypothetical protein
LTCLRWLASPAPCRQRGFCRYGIILDPIDRLPGEPRNPGDLADARGFPQHRLRTLELLAAIARLASLVGPRVPIGLRGPETPSSQMT